VVEWLTDSSQAAGGIRIGGIGVGQANSAFHPSGVGQCGPT